MITATKRLSH